eukprot:Skav226010  [mRNA]  locus=scaffold1010:192551:196779:+ [translate_table: standard]
MAVDPSFFDNAYRQCIARGMSQKECLSSFNSAVACLNENGGDISKCTTHLEALTGKKEAPKEEKSTFQATSEFCSKAGFKILALPVALVGLKFIKIK